jgi:hypothetical protein
MRPDRRSARVNPNPTLLPTVMCGDSRPSCYADLLSSRLPFLFCDQNPIRREALMTETVAIADLPWDRFRERLFAGGQTDPGAWHAMPPR